MIKDEALGESTDIILYEGNPTKWPGYDREVTS
jgi:hypothetical protein